MYCVSDASDMLFFSLLNFNASSTMFLLMEDVTSFVG